MQYSMTGYGRSERKAERFLIKCEVKTLNSKFLDFSPRLPKELATKETAIRSLISDGLKRGKVMLTIELEMDSNDSNNVQVDEVLFRKYYDKFRELARMVGDEKEHLVKLAIEAPEVIKQQDLSEADIPWGEVENCISDAIAECNEFRKKEGTALVEKLHEYITNIDERLTEIDQSDHKRENNIRSKIQKSLEEIKEKVKVDENRFEQELIFYLERLDISEEKVRLKQHLDFFKEILEIQPSAGKKLGFISQEIGREINTIGSKANDADIQRSVVVMKDELEKIKEQALNLL